MKISGLSCITKKYFWFFWDTLLWMFSTSVLNILYCPSSIEGTFSPFCHHRVWDVHKHIFGVRLTAWTILKWIVVLSQRYHSATRCFTFLIIHWLGAINLKQDYSLRWSSGWVPATPLCRSLAGRSSAEVGPSSPGTNMWIQVSDFAAQVKLFWTTSSWECFERSL